MADTRRWSPETASPGGGVLVVEDDELVAQALAISLRHAGYGVTLARNVEEALVAFDANPAEVVVTDLLMPGGTGLDLLRELDQRDPFVPVIIVTADMSLHSAAEAVREHAFDYLSKPVSRDQLISTVARALESRRHSRAKQQADQRLHEEHRQLAIRHQRTAMLLTVLYNRAVEGIIVLDSDGRLVDASDSFVALVGRPLYDLFDVDIRDLFDAHPTEGDIQSRVVRLIAAPISQGHWRGDMTVRAARGRRVPARVSLSVCETPSVDGDDPQTRYVIALLYYETAHEELSRQLQQADRLATMGLLAGSAAHEIKNELGPLLGYLTMMEQGGSDGDSSAMIRIMRDSVKRVQEHVEQLLAPLRHRVRTRGAVSLRDVTDGILTLLRRAGRLRRLRLELESPEEDVIVHADKNEVHQIGLNLITNALDALGDGGGGDRGSVRVTMTYEGEYGVLRVADSGAGIPEALRARVFEPFFTTKGSAGTGLGLPVVLDIVRGLAGRVEVDTPADGGTVFTVYLPRYRPDRAD
jgi:signal transduction histidine kinase/CheY-like chemotaxis protein